MKINKYLKKIGYTKWDMPGYYNPRGVNIKNADKPGADIRNKEDSEGFCSYEFFSLDHTLSMYIYSKLCYFREYILPLGGVPGCLSNSDWTLSKEEKKKADKEAEDKWHEIIDKMILAFELQLDKTEDRYRKSGVEYAQIKEGMQLFVEYYNCLWY